MEALNISLDLTFWHASIPENEPLLALLADIARRAARAKDARGQRVLQSHGRQNLKAMSP
jgi:hypothetical protein